MEEYSTSAAKATASSASPTANFREASDAFSVADESELILLGYIAFLDPAKDTSAKAIASLRQFGVATKILTGDNELVHEKVCNDVGITARQGRNRPEASPWWNRPGFSRALSTKPTSWHA